MWRFRTFATLQSIGAVRCVFQSKQFAVACKDLPLTPSGKNPYDVLELTVTPATNLDDVSKQFRSMVVQNHPDKPGGSTEKMSEINLAYKIVKENHDAVIRKWKEVESTTQANEVYRRHNTSRLNHHDDMGRRGGLHRRKPIIRPPRRSTMHGETTSESNEDGSNGNNDETTSTANSSRYRNRSYGEEWSSQSCAAPHRPRLLREIAEHWTKYRDALDESVKSMSNRYELAVQIGTFLNKSTALGEVTARERWLRKSFIKAMWEDVHELRAELLRHGTRSAQHSEMAEEMVHIASTSQRKMDEDFQRITRKCVTSQVHIYISRLIKILLICMFVVAFCKNLVKIVFRSTISSRYRAAMLTEAITHCPY